jgi:RHS repeat-associated protein
MAEWWIWCKRRHAKEATSVNEVTNLYQANELNQYTNINEGAVEPVYDADGNMTLFGLWTYAWDAENRLISVASNGVPVVQNQYDYMSRRIMKATATQTNTFLYDGWNLIREDLGAAAPSSRSYVWGLDLSQSLQGAGGVGGLLAMLTTDSCLLTPAYDANGNISEYVGGGGSVVAHYEYDAFGKEISRSGAEAQSHPFRFSTKYTDDESGLVYYGYRYYSPELGRWISSDPQNEIGSLNVIYKDVLADLRQKRALADAARIQNANQNPEITPDILAYLNQKYRTEFVLPSAVSSEPDVLMVIMAVDPNLYLFVVNNPVFFVDVDGRDWWPPSKWPIWPKPKDPGTWPIGRCQSYKL